MLTRDFTQKQMKKLRPEFKVCVNRLIDEILASSSLDHPASALTLKLPVMVVSMPASVPYDG
jgi:hypothetical protein